VREVEEVAVGQRTAVLAVLVVWQNVTSTTKKGCHGMMKMLRVVRL
jgi:hypothetical protein